MEEIKGGSNAGQPGEFSAASYNQAIRELCLAKSSDDLLDRLLKKIDELLAPGVAIFLLREQVSKNLKYVKIIGLNSQNFILYSRDKKECSNGQLIRLSF
ncbi:MAG: hypothetical protein PHQ48_08705 [Acidobacteriota bacterium]|nr:hypothetical protein [Acidobacteriota bacterium]